MAARNASEPPCASRVVGCGTRSLAPSSAGCSARPAAPSGSCERRLFTPAAVSRLVLLRRPADDQCARAARYQPAGPSRPAGLRWVQHPFGPAAPVQPRRDGDVLRGAVGQRGPWPAEESAGGGDRAGGAAHLHARDAPLRRRHSARAAHRRGVLPRRRRGYAPLRSACRPSRPLPRPRPRPQAVWGARRASTTCAASCSARRARSGMRVLVSQLAPERAAYSAVLTRIPLYSLYSSPLSSRGVLNTLHNTVFPP